MENLPSSANCFSISSLQLSLQLDWGETTHLSPLLHGQVGAVILTRGVRSEAFP